LAAVRLNIAGLFLTRLTGNSYENILHSISECESSLRYYTEDNYPTQWASTQKIIGMAYAFLSKGDLVINLQKSINALKKSLRVYKENKFPKQWAQTQKYLGLAYFRLSGKSSNPDKNLKSGINACEFALRFYTESEHPNEWAELQSALGDAYMFLPSGDRSENLRRTITFHNNALKIFTSQIHSEQSKRISQNKEIALHELKEIQKNK
jgi:hypothetical protein